MHVVGCSRFEKGSWREENGRTKKSRSRWTVIISYDGKQNRGVGGCFLFRFQSAKEENYLLKTAGASLSSFSCLLSPSGLSRGSLDIIHHTPGSRYRW